MIIKKGTLRVPSRRSSDTKEELSHGAAPLSYFLLNTHKIGQNLEGVKSMQRNQKRGRRQPQVSTRLPWQEAVIGLLLSVVVSIIMTILIAGIFYMEWVSAGALSYSIAAYLIMALSVLIGAVYTLQKTKGKDRVWALLVPIGYWVIRWILTLIFPLG